MPPNAVYKAQPIDKGSMISLIFLGIATFIFLAQLGYGIFSRESSKVNGNARAKAIARKREAERTQGKAEVSEGEHIKVPKSVGKAA